MTKISDKSVTALMPMGKALWILSEAHTRDDSCVGFTVESSPNLSPRLIFTQAEYVEAWRSVRYNIGKQIEPRDDRAELLQRSECIVYQELVVKLLRAARAGDDHGRDEAFEGLEAIRRLYPESIAEWEAHYEEKNRKDARNDG